MLIYYGLGYCKVHTKIIWKCKQFTLIYYHVNISVWLELSISDFEHCL